MSWVTVGVAAAGALAGKAKNDRARQVETADRNLAAETQRYSPWTGISAGPIRHANSQFGDVFSGGVQGAMMGNSVKNGMQGMKNPNNLFDQGNNWKDMNASQAMYDANDKAYRTS
jgi:hypothetical protein